MKQHKAKLLFVALLFIAGATAARAQGGQSGRAQTTSQTATPPQVTGFRADVLREIDTTGARLVQLAEATPADKFSWRPMEGVRSISEVYMHVAAANYGILGGLGLQPPAGINPRELESITDKARVVEILRQSFAQARATVANSSDDMERSVQLFGRPATARNALFIFVNHMHEHLGQSIAYARMNRIVPPWTAEREERRRQQGQPQQQPARRP
jgi:uncharacterized damage-inducible protein DinB